MTSVDRRGTGLTVALVATALLFVTDSPLPAQECVGGWARSCSSVEVRAAGDQLLFYVPNAAPPAARAAQQGAAAGSADQRVRVLRNTPGAVCDPATGRGCVDVTEEWLSPPGDPADPEEAETCERPSGDAGGGSPARSEEEDDGCAAKALLPRPTAEVTGAVFAVSVPATAFLWLFDRDGPVVVRSATDDEGSGGENGDPSSDENGPGNGASGDSGTGGDGDSGNGNSGDSGTGDNGDNGNNGNGDNGDNGDNGTGDTGSSNTGSDDGDDGNGNGNNGSSGNNGNGNNGNGNNGSSGDNGSNGNSGSNGDNDNGDGLDWPQSGDKDRPPMTEVPEPVSTTLFGLGLLGYGAARLRRRGGEAGEEVAQD